NRLPRGMSRAIIAQVSRSGATANRPAVTGTAHRGITGWSAANSAQGIARPAPTMKWVMADANSAPQVGVVLLEPVFADGAEDVEIERVFERHGAVRYVGRNAQDLSLADHDVAAADLELERALEDVGDLFAFVVVLRHDRAFGEEDLGHHGLVACNDLTRYGVA